MLLERLELYCGAGMPLDKALLAAGEGGSTKHQASLSRAAESVSNGIPLAKSLAGAIIIPGAVLGLIEHGQSSGRLVDMIGSARSLMDRGEDLKSQCVSAAIYPCVIGSLAVLLVIGLVKGVMPQIVPMLLGLRVELPLLTRMVMAASDAVGKYGLPILAGIATVTPLSAWVYRKHLGIQRVVHKIVAKTPLVGALVRDYAWSVFLRSCGSLVQAGIAAVDAYETAASRMPLVHLRDVIKERSAAVRGGTGFKAIAEDERLVISPHLSQLIAAGEASGNLGEALTRSADILDKDIERRIKRLSGLMEPALMASMGMMVGSIALAIMMPIYDMSRALQQ